MLGFTHITRTALNSGLNTIQASAIKNGVLFDNRTLITINCTTSDLVLKVVDSTPCSDDDW